MSPMHRRTSSLLKALVCVAASLHAAQGRAEEIRVPEDHITIRDAVAAASDGDVILVGPDDYPESIRISGKDLTIRSLAGPEETIIRATNYDNAVFVIVDNATVEIEGFELREGTGNCDLFFCDGGAVNLRDSTAVFKDCIIRDNSVTFDGGAIYVDEAELTLEDTVVERNRSEWYNGGAIYAIGATVVIRNSTFRDNYGDDGGGAILSIESSILIEGGRYEANSTAGAGGAIKTQGGSLVVRDAVFEGNHNDGAGGAIEVSSPFVLDGCVFRANDGGGHGGGVRIRAEGEVRDCVFDSNTTYGVGPGLSAYGAGSLLVEGCEFRSNVTEVANGGGIHVSESPLTVRDCLFVGNEAHNGGGIEMSGGTVTSVVVGSRFVGNRSTLGQGGGIRCTRPDLYVANCVFHGNETVDRGGAIRVDAANAVIVNSVMSGNRAYWWGGAIDAHNYVTKVVNCAVVDNECYSGGGGLHMAETGIVANSIVRGNFSTRWRQISNNRERSEVGLVASNIESWAIEEDDTFDDAPGFVSRRGPDSIPGTGDEDYRLSSCASGIDLGVLEVLPPDLADLDGDGDVVEPVPLDLFGAPRVSGATVDVGPAEWFGSGPPCPSDLDCDGNGVWDRIDIDSCDGSIGCLDCDGNGRPDRCDFVRSQGVLNPGIGYWRFEGGTQNLGLGGIEGQLVGDASIGDQPGPAAIPGLLGAVNGGVLEVGDQGFMRIRDPEQLYAMGESDFTIEAWVRLDELGTTGGGTRQYLLHRKPGDSPGYKIDYSVLAQGGNLRFNVNRAYGKTAGITGRELALQFGENGSTWCVTSNLQIDEVGWHHISFTYDHGAGTVRFGLDGEFETIAHDSPGRYAWECNLLVGVHVNASGQANQRLRGAIDELRISRSVLRPSELLNAWPVGSSGDCNENGRIDWCDILDGTLEDADRDGLPDVCVVGVCDADLDGDGAVGGSDLGLLFLEWGGPGSADFDGDGVVGGSDLGQLFLAWGPCAGGCDPGVCDDDDECTIDGCDPIGGGCTTTILPGCVTDPCFEVVCDDGDSCTVDQCDPTTGECLFTPIPGCVPDPCEDLDCDDDNPCTADDCDSEDGECVHTPIDGCVPFPCGDPKAGSCFVANPTPNCDNASCCKAVCLLDDFCCTTIWDSSCADLAEFACP